MLFSFPATRAPNIGEMNITWYRAQNKSVTTAAISAREFAMYVSCTAGWSVRWYQMKFPTPGFMEVFKTEAEARAAIEVGAG
jgi:hypothetical protein